MTLGRYSVIIAIVATVMVATAQADMWLTMLPGAAQDQGAVCLDGSPMGYYYKPAFNSTYANSWIIYIQGGGWCYELADCSQRATSTIGSSKQWPPSMTVGGPLSEDPVSNPDFAYFNHVVLPYCDGASFSGNVEKPVVTTVGPVKTLYFRGRRNLDAVFNDLLASRGLNTAKEVLLTGCSAGGLSTYLHADYIGTLLPPTVQKYRAMPGSGFFLLHNTVQNTPVYPNEMQTVFNMQNCSANVNSNCIASTPAADQWKCIFAQYSYQYIKTPIFVLNSAYDSWQMQCIFTSEPVPENSTANGSCSSAPGWYPCMANISQCNSTEVTQMNSYGASFTQIISNTTTFYANGNGAFIDSCYSHCEFQGSGWNHIKLHGVSMQQAVSVWWNGPLTVPASKNTYTDCTWTGSSQCNPTC